VVRRQVSRFSLPWESRLGELDTHVTAAAACPMAMYPVRRQGLSIDWRPSIVRALDPIGLGRHAEIVVEQ
jgi:hypothetical protein